MFDLPVDHMYTASLNKDGHVERWNPMHSIIEAVSVQRPDHFCATQDIVPDLIKIDVESHESAVLRGMGDLLKHHQPTLICEVWAKLKRATSTTFSLATRSPIRCHFGV